MVGGLSFKSFLSDGRTVWVKVREINYLIEKGIMTVDEKALKEFVDNIDEDYNAMMRLDSLEGGATDMLGRELNDQERQMLEAAKKAMRGEC
jgi:hypothetical protein